MTLFSPGSAAFAVGPQNAPRSVIIFHGYTGSPDEFRPLAETLAARLDAHVTVPLLPGHGTDEYDLLDLKFDDFLAFARACVAEATQSKKPFAIMGHCFGGHLAGIIAADAKPSALVFTIVPFELRFPFQFRLTAWLIGLRKMWNKRWSVSEKIARIGIFVYRDMPGKGLSLVQEGNRRLRENLPRVHTPILALQTGDDPLARPESGDALIAASGAHERSKAIVLSGRKHALFFGKGWEIAVDDIADFLEAEMVKKEAADT